MIISHAAGEKAPLSIVLVLVLAFVAVWPPAASPAIGQTVIAAAAGKNLAVVSPTRKCADLGSVDLTAVGGAGSAVTTATETTGVGGAAVCSVRGVLAPAIKFQVDLPLAGWMQRYLQTGCGGLCGNLRINVGAADGCPAVAAGGFVIASTDMGHEGMGGDFGRDPQKRADFAYRGVHLTALTAKALIRLFYGQPERYAYFSGCSDGGREALIEAQRFPHDFNGIIAGAPAMNFTVQNSLFHGWQARSNTGPDGKPILLAPRLAILHAAVLRACDARDGQTDGLVSMPGACRFEPEQILCLAGQDPATCLTAAEVTVARRFYAGPRDPKTGERLTPGGPQYGSELEWAGVYVPKTVDQPIFSAMIANESMPNLIFANGQPATVDQLVFDRATFDRVRERHNLFDASNPDLSAFAGAGGKLMLFHGWADPHISPLNTIAYYDALRRQMGAQQVAEFARLYLMPGMGHCSGGEGPSKFDLLGPMMAWVERDSAPDAILTRTAAPDVRGDFGQPVGVLRGPPPPTGAPPPGQVPMAGPGPHDRGPPPAMPAPVTGPARSRPVYPYPYIATYSGAGDPNAAANWQRGKAVPVEVPAWAGSDFYTPYHGVSD